MTEADEIVDFLGLGRYADALISHLSTGTRRIVELAGLIALDAGGPDEVRADPKVIASYLGTDDRAINRSKQPLEPA